MPIRKNSAQMSGKGSFYGVHRHIRTNLSPNIGLKAPINELCGPHIAINGMLPVDAHAQHGEEKLSQDLSSS